MNAVLLIDTAGPAITIQDAGRPGYARYGLSAGGAMDPWAMAEGEALLGNPPGLAALEMAGYGGRFRMLHEPCWCALTGAAMQARLDGIPLPWRASFSFLPGQLLEIGPALAGVEGSGTYGYLHVAGGLDTPREIGARGTHVRAGIGGLDGGTLQSGTRLPLGTSGGADRTPSSLPLPEYLASRTIRVVWGPQSGRFRADTRDRLLKETFTVSHRRDRMAMRLDMAGADPFESLLTGLSDPAMMGDIQVTGDGCPTVLMREHQPTGGYPRIATVITADLAAVAQLPSGAPFRFALAARDEAVGALRDWQDGLGGMAERIRPIGQMDELLAQNLISGVVSANDP